MLTQKICKNLRNVLKDNRNENDICWNFEYFRDAFQLSLRSSKNVFFQIFCFLQSKQKMKKQTEQVETQATTQLKKATTKGASWLSWRIKTMNIFWKAFIAEVIRGCGGGGEIDYFVRIYDLWTAEKPKASKRRRKQRILNCITELKRLRFLSSPAFPRLGHRRRKIARNKIANDGVFVVDFILVASRILFVLILLCFLRRILCVSHSENI